ncbi:7TM GPCR serpentine receptor class x (Srx) domain-containing protein [Caenorhabditis elegans]|uniref:7TM GPCR serpentine receptor class x (Srx) domain-containing protein n=1 Tax=Caenorhabditis elegans TaxID=6239 RepID=Q93798_CAEEL|nr:7TM GPCR serpentine receptor class x (Srx) domain-containing protein [Caenorhabditis elegans]CAB02128.3 7TM GPCR serpentine receptor class x (Srx) domain-containing protein [Caenorhabditis elegans]|eukprot:NP_506426.3 Serpentine Receptor, class X [Caenorhabditis elegans]
MRTSISCIVVPDAYIKLFRTIRMRQISIVSSPSELIFAKKYSFFLSFQTSLLGSICNIYLLLKFSARDGRPNGFQKICLVKTVPNIIVCLSFLFWVVPLTAFSYSYNEVNYWLNSLVGGVAGTWAYLLTPILQVSMSCNRFYVLYFPFGIKLVKKVPMTNVIITIASLSVSIVAATTLPKGCGYVYDPEFLQWIPEEGKCAETVSSGINYAIIIFTISSNSFNIATASRLLMRKIVGLTKQDSSKRRKRWMIMFLQSVMQDCLHLVDSINATYLWKLSEELWFQCIFLTLSFITIYTLDGFVMLVFNQDIQPKWCRSGSKGERTSAMMVTSKISVTTMT